MRKPQGGDGGAPGAPPLVSGSYGAGEVTVRVNEQRLEPLTT
jgi:hypothetical protein